jgi:hypothetical protein
MLPNADYQPSSLSQYLRLFGVPLAIAGELRLPIAGVRARDMPVLGAAVPEARIHENRDLSPGEDDVRADRSHALEPERQVDAEPKPPSMQERPQPQLG